MIKKSTIVPPIKSQGIKTKLVPWINNIIQRSDLDLAHTNWIEPFFGTGVVGLNAPVGGHRYIADSNPHIIKFYNGILQGDITPQNMRSYRPQQKKDMLIIEKSETALIRNIVLSILFFSHERVSMG